MFKILFVLFVSICFVNARHEEYDGHSLYQIKVENADQVYQLMDVVERLLLDVWTYAHPERDGLILVSKELKPQFEDELNIIGLTYKIDTENIKEKLVLEDQLLANSSLLSKTKKSQPGISFDEIHRYAVVDRYLTELADRYPAVVQVVSGGRSVEGRDIKYLRISDNNFQTNNKPVIVIQSLLHAREWITLPVALYAIHKLVIDVTEQDLVKDIDWIIIPIANPDGYEFSHTGTRMWRKNRGTGSGSCIGVDLNRNFNFNWGTASSNQACSDTFHGPRAVSEPETQTIGNILYRYRTRIALFIDAHSFGSMIVYGYGNGQVPPNANTLHQVATQMARGIDAVKWSSNRNYRVGNIVDVLNYRVSGGCSDFAQRAIGNRLSYAFELPQYRNQNGLNGFLVDPAFIPQVGFETWEGIKIAARHVIRNRQ